MMKKGRRAWTQQAASRIGLGHRKVCYRGIAKNGAQVFSLLALANLYLARRTLAFPPAAVSWRL
jgi:IS5 family transposase